MLNLENVENDSMKFAKKAKINKISKNEEYFFGQHPLVEKSPNRHWYPYIKHPVANTFEYHVLLYNHIQGCSIHNRRLNKIYIYDKVFLIRRPRRRTCLLSVFLFYFFFIYSTRVLCT